MSNYCLFLTLHLIHNCWCCSRWIICHPCCSTRLPPIFGPLFCSCKWCCCFLASQTPMRPVVAPSSGWWNFTCIVAQNGGHISCADCDCRINYCLNIRRRWGWFCFCTAAASTAVENAVGVVTMDYLAGVPNNICERSLWFHTGIVPINGSGSGICVRVPSFGDIWRLLIEILF